VAQRSRAQQLSHQDGIGFPRRVRLSVETASRLQIVARTSWAAHPLRFSVRVHRPPCALAGEFLASIRQRVFHLRTAGILRLRAMLHVSGLPSASPLEPFPEVVIAAEKGRNRGFRERYFPHEPAGVGGATGLPEKIPAKRPQTYKFGMKYARLTGRDWLAGDLGRFQRRSLVTATCAAPICFCARARDLRTLQIEVLFHSCGQFATDCLKKGEANELDLTAYDATGSVYNGNPPDAAAAHSAWPDRRVVSLLPQVGVLLWSVRLRTCAAAELDVDFIPEAVVRRSCHTGGLISAPASYRKPTARMISG